MYYKYMTQILEPEPRGERWLPPTLVKTALGSNDGRGRAILILLDDSAERMIWEAYFQELGFATFVPDDLSEVFDIPPRLTGPKCFVLVDPIINQSSVSAILDRKKINKFVITSAYEASREDIFDTTSASAIFVRCSSGNPSECEVIINPKI